MGKIRIYSMNEKINASNEKEPSQLSEKDQAHLLMSRDMRLINKIDKENIKINKLTLKNHMMQSGFVEKLKREYQAKPDADGQGIEEMQDGKFEVTYQERGSAYQIVKFENRDQLLNYLADEIFHDFNLD
jgi:hypothetical protein